MGRRLWKNWGSAVVTFAAYFTGQFSEIPGKKFCCEYLHCHTVTECTIIQHFPNYTTTSLLRSGQALLNKLCYIEECYIEMSAPSGAVKPACVMSVSIISIAGLLWKEWVVICCLYSWLLRSVYYLPSFSGCVGQCCMMQVTGIKKHYLVLCFIVGMVELCAKNLQIMRNDFTDYALTFSFGQLCANYAHFLPIMRRLCATILKIMRALCQLCAPST